MANDSVWFKIREPGWLDNEAHRNVINRADEIRWAHKNYGTKPCPPLTACWPC